MDGQTKMKQGPLLGGLQMMFYARFGFPPHLARKINDVKHICPIIYENKG